MNYGFGMLALYVRDMEKATAFYTEFLGMKLIPEFSGPTFAYLQPTSGTAIALQPLSTLPAGETEQAGGFEINLEVDDLDAAWQEWQSKGVEIVAQIADMGAGRWFRAKDTENHIIAVYQMYPQFKH